MLPLLCAPAAGPHCRSRNQHIGCLPSSMQLASMCKADCSNLSPDAGCDVPRMNYSPATTVGGAIAGCAHIKRLSENTTVVYPTNCSILFHKTARRLRERRYLLQTTCLHTILGQAVASQCNTPTCSAYSAGTRWLAPPSASLAINSVDDIKRKFSSASMQASFMSKIPVLGGKRPLLFPTLEHALAYNRNISLQLFPDTCFHIPA